MKMFRSSLDQTANKLTEELRKKAISRSWPISVALNITVIYKSREDQYSVYYPPEFKQQVELLEYGDRNTPPNPVIRPFLYSELKSTDIADEVLYNLEEDLINNLGFADLV